MGDRLADDRLLVADGASKLEIGSKSLQVLALDEPGYCVRSRQNVAEIKSLTPHK